ncbi:TetR/AcrR family transcriptional regulator [Streptomyces sp. 8L]|uniref:TetR/AcrR family transcriptional regulator n=1 Tax=Streptomyces sp. 8L TaxID=2877242 RepID=UPI001CD54892|nr:TetR/AcrR family transcriptional regulator [Streptomyces sp. 8L]MCA1220226.1 TetR/AcrR family transcriptional regulator [Streptomyces sp. 8L]
MPGKRSLHPRKQPKQARGELTRERVLTAAAQVFADYGYAAGTTNRIAQRAGVSIGTLYQYYPNKDAILVQLVSRHLDRGESAMRRRQESGLPDTVAGVARALVRIAVENHLDDSGLLRVMAEQAPRSPELLRKVREHEEARVAYMCELLARYPEVGVGSVEMAARIVVSTIELVVHKVVATQEAVDLAEFEDELVAMMTRYLAPGA